MENVTKPRPHNPKGCFTVRKHKIICKPCPDPDCGRAKLLEANNSGFYTDRIAEATRSINKILSEIQPDSEGQVLAFIQTRMGIMLTWVEHKDEDENENENEIAVTSADDNDTLAKALDLKNYNSRSQEID